MTTFVIYKTQLELDGSGACGPSGVPNFRCSSIDIDTPLLLGEATVSIEVALQRSEVEHGVRITLTDADGAHPSGDCQEDNNQLTVSFDDL